MNQKTDMSKNQKRPGEPRALKNVAKRFFKVWPFNFIIRVNKEVCKGLQKMLSRVDYNDVQKKFNQIRFPKYVVG